MTNLIHQFFTTSVSDLLATMTVAGVEESFISKVADHVGVPISDQDSVSIICSEDFQPDEFDSVFENMVDMYNSGIKGTTESSCIDHSFSELPVKSVVFYEPGVIGILVKNDSEVVESVKNFLLKTTK